MGDTIYSDLFGKKQRIPRDETALIQLAGLMEIGSLINSTLALNDLLGIVMEIAKNVMNADASSLLLIDDERQRLYYEVALGDKADEVKKLYLDIGQGIAGWVAGEGRSLIVDDVTSDQRFCTEHDASSGFKTKSVACVPLKTKKRIVGVLEAINPSDGNRFCPEDLRLLEVIGSQAAVAIENARMHEQLLQKQRVEQEMQIARQIQKSFLPESNTRSADFLLEARNDSFWEVGGDFFRYCRTPGQAPGCYYRRRFRERGPRRFVNGESDNGFSLRMFPAPGSARSCQQPQQSSCSAGNVRDVCYPVLSGF